MAKIVRYNGNLVPFASASLGTERTIFGEVTQADDITSQYTADFLRGWGIVGPSDQPTLQDFNAVSYTHGQILSYLHQTGVAEYNATQEYHIGSLANVGGTLYSSLTNTNVGNAPASSPAFWELLNGSLNVVGDARNVRCAVSAASATATFTADQVIVSESLTGKSYRLAGVSKPIDLASTGAGGMDVGLAPVSGYVAIYAIYNPVTGVSALLVTDATAAAAPEVYGGANMPAGYTTSALVAVWPTNASRLLVPGLWVDRRLDLTAPVQVLSVGAPTALTSLSIATAAPKNAKSCKGYMTIVTINAASASIVLTSGASISAGQVQLNIGVQAAATFYESFFGLLIESPQAIAYSTSGINSTFIAGIAGYTI